MSRAFQAMRSIVTRGRVALAVMNPKRTLVQLTGLADEVKSSVELLLPYGMSARPKAGDVVMLQVGNSRAHLVALGADDPALRIADLDEGEFGFRDTNGQQVVFRKDRLEVITPLKLVMTVQGDLEQTVEGDLKQTVNGTATVTCDDINLGGAGGKKVALHGDPVKNGGGATIGTIEASSAKVKAL